MQKRKKIEGSIWKDNDWNVVSGQIRRPKGNPGKVSHLFKFIAEKIPFDALPPIHKKLQSNGIKCEGVYMAHDSMGVARYGGRGQIFTRLGSHKKKLSETASVFLLLHN